MTKTAETEATERARFIAKVEEGLADVKAGRVYTHAEVLAEMLELFPVDQPPSSSMMPLTRS